MKRTRLSLKVRKAFMEGIARMAFEKGFKKGFGKCNELVKEGNTEQERIALMKKFRIFAGSQRYAVLLFKPKVNHKR